MNKKLGPVFALLAGTIWGVMGVFVRHFAALGLPSLEIGWFRVFFGLVLVAAYLAIFNRDAFKVRLRDIPLFIGTGVGSLFFMNICHFTAISHVSLAVAGVLLYTAPIFVMLFSALFFKEKITGRKVLCLAMAFVGCGLVSGIAGGVQAPLVGILWGLGAGLSYSMYSVIGRLILRRGYQSWTMILYTFLFCTVANCLFCDWSVIGSVFRQPAELPWAVCMGFVTAFLPYVFYSAALVRMESSRATILASIEPVVGALCGIFLYNELPDFWGVLGMVLVLGAICLLSMPEKAAKNAA